MDEVLHEPGLSDPDIQRLLGELSLGGRSAPVLAISGARVVLASRSMLDLFGSGDLAELGARLGRRDPGARRILQLALDMPVGGAPRLERLRFFFGHAAEPLTFLCRTVVRGGERLLVAAVLSGTDVLGRAQPPARPAEDATPSSPPHAPETAVDREPDTPSLPVDLAPLRERMRAAVPAGRLRFAWRTDATGCISEWPSLLADLLGPAGDCRGHDLVSFSETWQVEADGRLRAAFDSHESWTLTGLSWPVADEPARVPIDLGAVPQRAANGEFDGFRGFGLAHPDALAPGGIVVLPAPAAEPVAAPPSAPAVAEPETPPVAAEDGNIVPLRRGAHIGAGAGRVLSSAEETAFQEIAVLLAGGPAAPAPAPAEPLAEPVVRDDTADRIALLDAQAAGLLVCRDDSILYANATLRGMADAEALAGGRAALFDGETLRGPSGTTCPVLVAQHPVTWDGAPADLLTVWPDTGGSSGRPGGHEADELAAILDTASDGVVLIDPRGDVLAINRTGEALFGRERVDVVGQSFDRLVAPESRAAAQRYFEGRRTSGVKVLLNDGCELVGLTAQGGTFPLFMTISAVGADEQTFCALLRDMTHWRKVEQDLRDARQEAERANAAKTDFLAKVSHEIRTPLNAIIGFAEVMMDERLGSLGNERYRDYLRDMHASGTHVVSLVNDLLDLAKIDAGKMDLQIAAIDLNGIITGCIALMQVEANRERVIVRQSLAAGLPPVLADERAVKQIMLNLLSNALKYNEPGGQVIVGTTAADSGQVLVRIRDTGIGMTDAEIAIALEPFRTVAPAQAGGGTGLGLPLTKALAEANGAAFAIRSRKGEGTLVEIAFPTH